MAGRKSDFTLTRLDDLFSTQEQRDEEKLQKSEIFPLELITISPTTRLRCVTMRICSNLLRVLRNVE